MGLISLYRDILEFLLRRIPFNKEREEIYNFTEFEKELYPSWAIEFDTQITPGYIGKSKKIPFITKEYLANELENDLFKESTPIKGKLTEQIYYLGVRQAAFESTATDWVMGLDERVAELENRLSLEIDNEKQLLRKNTINLSEIGQLQDNWNQYGAKKFSQELVFRCMHIITSTDLSFQPEIYPTARRSIQLEYEPDRNHYLEIEVFDNNIKLFAKELGEEYKKNNLSIDDTIRELNDFQTRFRNS